MQIKSIFQKLPFNWTENCKSWNDVHNDKDYI